MLQEINDLYHKMLNQWVKEAQPMWFDFLKSDAFLKWMKLFHIYYFDSKKKVDQVMEQMLEGLRLASKEDVKDLVDAQRLIIDMLEELNDRVRRLEEQNKKK